MTYLIVDLHIKKASMLQCISVIAPTPVFAAIMMTHALDKKMNNRLGIQGVGLVHKNYRPWVESLDKSSGGLEHVIVQRRGAYLFDSVATPQSNSLQPNALADYHWTLILDCSQQLPSEIKNEVTNLLETMRFAGGNIVRAKASLTDDWNTALRMSRPGFWIDDVSNLLESSDQSPAELLVSSCAEKSWVMPSTLGYSLLAKPVSRIGARDEHEHSFVEHMLGLVQFKAMNQVFTTLTPANLWRFGWSGDEFLVTNRQISLSSTATF